MDFGGRTVLFQSLVGSHNYNLNTETSDKDYKIFLLLILMIYIVVKSLVKPMLVILKIMMYMILENYLIYFGNLMLIS